MPDVNILAVAAAGIAGFVLGGLWYSPVLFAGRWQKETGINMETGLRYPVWLPMILAVVLSIVGAIAIAWFAGPMPTLRSGAIIGAVLGFLAIVPAMATSMLFEQNSPVLIAINTLYPALQFTLMGAVIGLFG